MTLVGFDFEAGTDGAALTTALSGATTVALNGGSTGIFDAASAQNGLMGAKITSVSTQLCLARFSAPAANNVMALEIGFTAPTTPTTSGNSPTIIQVRNATGAALRVYYTNGNNISFDGATVTGFQLAHSGLVPGQKYRIALLLTVGASTTTGVVKSNLYLGNSTTPIGSQFVSTTFNLGTTPLSNVDIGVINSVSQVFSVGFDDVRLNDGATTEIGPVPVTTATVTPTSVVDNSGVFTNQGGAASLQAAVADASDTTYVESPTAPVNKTVTFGVGSLAAGNVKVTVRARMQPTGGPATTALVELLQGTTVIAAGTATTVTDTWADYVLTLTAAQNSAITDRTSLRVRVTANQP